MDWKGFWNDRGGEADQLAQVARIGGRGAQDEEMLSVITTHIVTTLGITQNDSVLDVCCGNGLLTARLAKHCERIEGVDFSDVLVGRAREHFPGIPFHCGDALNLGSITELQPGSFSRINLYFSFQYFESVEAGRKVIEGMLKLLKPGGRILLGDVPDRDRFFVYYHSFRRIFTLLRQMLNGRNDMGKFWSEDELSVICRSLGVKGEKLKQPGTLPYSSYRMDWLITA